MTALKSGPAPPAGMYSALPYAVAQGTVETPYIFVQALFFSVITYFLFHLQVDAGETPVPNPSLSLILTLNCLTVCGTSGCVESLG